MEIPCEDDMGLLLTTLAAQFPGVCGLKYRTESRSLRGVRLVDGKLQPPDGGWGSNVYLCVFPKGKPTNDCCVMRATFVLSRRLEKWENVHWHNS